MKISIPVVGATLLFILFTAVTAESQTWTRCKYTIDGTIQSFPNGCPPSWYPI
jgi:hypothetical protein